MEEAGEFQGIVLYRRDFKETDLLVKFLTDKYGKKMFFIRGAKRRSFKLSAGILPFTHGQYIGNVKKDGLSFLDVIQSAEQFQNIGQDIIKNAYATYCLGLIDAAFPDNEPIPMWFDKILQVLTRIDEGMDAEVFTHIVEVQLLPAFGVAPNWQDCSICHRRDRLFDYSEQYGGLICDRHWHLDPNRFHATQRAIFLLRKFSVINFDNVKSIEIKPQTKIELKVILDRIYDDTVGLSLKSKHFIDHLNDFETKIPPLKPRKHPEND